MPTLKFLALIMLLTGVGMSVADAAGPRLHPPRTVSGTKSRMLDGDTFDLKTIVRGVIRTRFAAIDAPERGQAYSRQSRSYLQNLLSRGGIEVQG